MSVTIVLEISVYLTLRNEIAALFNHPVSEFVAICINVPFSAKKIGQIPTFTKLKYNAKDILQEFYFLHILPSLIVEALIHRGGGNLPDSSYLGVGNKVKWMYIFVKHFLLRVGVSNRLGVMSHIAKIKQSMHRVPLSPDKLKYGLD